MSDFSRKISGEYPPPMHVKDRGPREGDGVAMSEISREELDAKLDGTVAKLNARLAAFESAVKEMLAAMRVDMVNLRAELRGNLADIRAQLHGSLADIRAQLHGDSADTRAELRESSAGIHAELRAMHVDLSYLKNLKANIWGAAVVTMGLVGAFHTYGVSSFDSGRDTSELFQELKQQTRETRMLLEELKLQRAASAPAAITPLPNAPQSR
jgi:hypothetical protein